jgi:tetratricopeptide (TPR) repeat protein
MAEIAGTSLVAAARALMRAGQWDLADETLAAATAGDAAESAALAVARAEVAVEKDFWRQTKGEGEVGEGSTALERATRALTETSAAGDRDLPHDLQFLQLWHDYATELFSGDGGAPRFGPEGRDLAMVAELSDRAERLRAAAPDPARRGWAAFCLALFADNLRGDPDTARPWFEEALACGEAGDGDDYLVSEALRHLGYLADQSGDKVTARAQWERSTELRQRAGAVPSVLSQQLLLAGLADGEGDHAAARVMAGQVRDWARAIGLERLASMAADLCD